MFRLVETETFSKWLTALESRGRARIQRRLDRLALGNPGDVKPVGKGVSEMRIDYGPGYRVYYFRRDREIIFLLAGGDKRSQRRDIELAVAIKEIVKDISWPK
jgi:putative addiction module killer protein